MLAALPDVEGVFAANDLMADGALAVLRAAGRAVPDAVAVVGFDDSTVAAGAHPPLTTERQPVEDMGGAMARLLLAELDAAGTADEPAADVPRVFTPTLALCDSA